MPAASSVYARLIPLADWRTRNQFGQAEFTSQSRWFFVVRSFAATPIS
jgi:hypothetical protein